MSSVDQNWLLGPWYNGSSYRPTFYAGALYNYNTDNFSWHFDIASVLSGSVDLYEDGTAFLTSGSATGAMGRPALGYSGVYGEYFTGDIGEVLILSTALSSTNRQKLEGYLAWKWGIQGNLPAGHPYKSAAP